MIWVPIRSINDLGEEICISIQVILTQFADIQHGTVWMLRIKIMVVAVTDMTAKCLYDPYMVIGI